MNYDVVVVGAGPAGAIAAKYAALKRSKNPPYRGTCKHRLTSAVYGSYQYKSAQGMRD